jgi:formiminotetrahydrofolate cyclodeaminase
MTAKAQRNSNKLMMLPTAKLMDEFGAGRPTPGSGSAAALQGLLACNMVLASCRLTVQKAPQPQRRLEAAYLANIIETKHIRQLDNLVQKDADLFAQAIDARKTHKAAKTGCERQRLAAKARRRLVTATELPLQVSEHCLKVAQLGFQMFDIGYSAARGDPGAGVAAAIAGANTALCVIFQNLSKFRGGKWAAALLKKCDEIRDRISAAQSELLRRIARLRDVVIQEFEGQANFLGQMEPAPQRLRTITTTNAVGKRRPSRKRSAA